MFVSTYNGEKYLSQQLDSILGQQEVDVSILIRDDGSKDGTIAILENYSSRFPNVSYYLGNNVGPCMSFFDLLNHSQGYDYYAFGDQDDVWDNDKLLRAIEMINHYSDNSPVLYCSNLRVVDKDLNFCRNAQSSYDTSRRYAALVDFYAVGCTEVFNQAAADITKSHLRTDCIMHDSWVFMICNFFGNVIYDNESHINYRQHDHNVIGTKKDKLSLFRERLKRVTNKTIQPRLLNAQLLYSEFLEQLSAEDNKKIQKVLNYKNGVRNMLSLLFDFDIRSNHILSDIRYRFLILLKKI